MRFSLAYNADGSILTTSLADQDAQRLPRSGDISNPLATTNQARNAELNKATEGLQDDLAARQLIQGNSTGGS